MTLPYAHSRTKAGGEPRAGILVRLGCGRNRLVRKRGQDADEGRISRGSSLTWLRPLFLRLANRVVFHLKNYCLEPNAILAYDQLRDQRAAGWGGRSASRLEPVCINRLGAEETTQELVGGKSTSKCERLAGKGQTKQSRRQ